MATFTPNKGYTIPTVNADLNIWGTENNNSWSLLDQNMGGTSTITLTGGNVIATSAQAGALIQNLTGTLTSAATYILPALGGFYMVENNTTGAFSVTIASSGGGKTFVITQGSVAWLVCDGTNIIPGNPDFLSGESFVNVAGNANVNATPTQAQSLVQVLTGALTGNIQYILPAAGRAYSIYNSTTGAFTVTIAGSGGGTTVTVPQGGQVLVYVDGSGNIFPLTTPSPTGSIDINVAGNANVTATAAQSAYLIQHLFGTLTAHITYTVPARVGFFCIKNGTTGTFTVTVTSAGGGRSVPVPQTRDAWFWTDGVNIFPATTGWIEIANITVVGAASANFVLPVSFSRFKVTLQQGSVNADSSISMQVSNDGGNSYITSGVYVFLAIGFNAASPNVPIGHSGVGSTAYEFCATSSGSSAAAMDATVEIWPGIAPYGATFRGSNLVSSSPGVYQQTNTMGSAGVTGVNAVRFFPTSAPLLSGTFIVEGLA
jgi:hypothetical protein